MVQPEVVELEWVWEALEALELLEEPEALE